MNSRLAIVFLLVFALLLMAVPACAQFGTSSITGLVEDESGAVVAAAKVVIKNEASGLSYQTTTTSAGTYKMEALPPGRYTVTVSRAGFRTTSSINNVLSVGAPLVVNINLKVGAVDEIVQVESSYERIETTSAQVSGVVTHQEVVKLPLNGRNPLSLVTLEPGLVQRTNGSQGSGTHVFGSRDRSHNVTIDGIDANESSVPNPQSNLYRLNPDNVEEFRVITHNATPETGRNSGANVSIATRTGTNDLHGDVFYFHRNTATSANEWFNNHNHIKKPVLMLHQFGADAGGPIIKDKTHWFFSYQGNRIAQTMPIAAAYGNPWLFNYSLWHDGIFRYLKLPPKNAQGQFTAPTPYGTTTSTALIDQTTGQVKPGIPSCVLAADFNCIASFNIYQQDIARSGAGADPKVFSMLQGLPAANDFTQGDGLNFNGFIWNPPSRFSGPNFLSKIDHKFNENNNLYATFIYTDYNTSEGDLLNYRPRVYPGFPPQGTVKRNSELLSLSYRHVFSSTMVNEFTLGFSRFRFEFPMRENWSGIDQPSFGQDCWTPSSFRDISLPYCTTPHTKRAVLNRQFIDNLSKMVGSHSIKAGFNIRLYSHNDDRGAVGGYNVWPTMVFNRTYRTGGFASLVQSSSTDNNRFRNASAELLGMVAYLSKGFVANQGDNQYYFGDGRLHTRIHQWDFYLQDEWRLKHNLTVNYGVRWEFNPPPNDAGGGTYIPDRDIVAAPDLGTVTFVKSKSWYKRNNVTALAPRVGIAWSPDSKTAVRAGYGIAFDTISTFQVTSIGGKVPGSFLVQRTYFSNSAPGSVLTNRVSSLLAGGDPFAAMTPTTAPTANFTPAPAALGTAQDIGAFPKHLRLPTVHEWSFTLQRELPLRIVGQVGYIGKRGTHLFRPTDANQIRIDQPGFMDAFLTAQRNYRAGCTYKGTGCPAGVTGTPVPLLVSLGGDKVDSGDMNFYLNTNGIGDLARQLDTLGFSTFKSTSLTASYFRPYPQFGQIFTMDNAGDSYYHGLIVQLRRRFERGMEFGLVYTFSKSIDDQSIDPVGATSGGGLGSTSSRTPTDYYRPWVDRSLSDFDNRHVLSIHYVYELPFGRKQRFAAGAPGWLNHVVGGWSMMGMYSFQSGEPFSVNSDLRTGNGALRTDRPDVVGPWPSTELKWVAGVAGPVVFDAGTAATMDANYCRPVNGGQTKFCPPAPGSFGIGRNTFWGPGFWNFDMAVSKNFDVTERVKMQFRTDFFNLFNHPNWENPRNASSGSPTMDSNLFGQTCCISASLPSSATVIAIGEPYRVIQFGLKLSF